MVHWDGQGRCHRKYGWGNWTAWCQKDVRAVRSSESFPDGFHSLLSNVYVYGWLDVMYERTVRLKLLAWRLHAGATVSVRGRLKEWVQVYIHFSCHSKAEMNVHRSDPRPFETLAHVWMWSSSCIRTHVQTIAYINAMFFHLISHNTLKNYGF